MWQQYGSWPKLINRGELGRESQIWKRGIEPEQIWHLDHRKRWSRYRLEQAADSAPVRSFVGIKASTARHRARRVICHLVYDCA